MKGRVHSHGTVCVITEEFIFFQTKPKDVTTQMKALSECINGTVCVITEESSFSSKRNLKV